ncbi:MAG: GGIII-like transmembrane region-containing protein, partial [Candidatus Heimdallarchaeota archaeon]
KQVANFFKQWWPYLTAGAGGLIIGILTIVIVVKVRKKKRAT